MEAFEMVVSTPHFRGENESDCAYFAHYVSSILKKHHMLTNFINV